MSDAKPVNLNPRERKVLRFLADEYSEDFGYHSFAWISKSTRLKRADVRLACRSLKRKGLAQFASGLCNDDGDFRGSGYSATSAGCDLIEAERPESKFAVEFAKKFIEQQSKASDHQS